MEDGEERAALLRRPAAVSRALDRAGFEIAASGTRHCDTARENGEERELTDADPESLFPASA